MTISDLISRGVRGLHAYQVPHPDGIRAKLDANELPHPLPAEAAADLGRVLAEVAIHRYPDSHAAELRQLLADDLGVAPEALVFGNGSDELIAMLCTAFGEPRAGRTRACVLCPDPTFAVYRIAALAHGLDCVEVPLDRDMELDLELLDDAMTGACPNLAFFALPNNPTGTLWPPEAVADLAARHPDTLVVADEAYLAYGGRTLVPRLADLPNLIVMRTLSKIGMAGLRVGLVAAAPDVVAELTKVRMPYNLGSLDQAAAVWMLRNQREWLAARAADVVTERQRLAAALSALRGVHVFPSQANLLLFRVGEPGEGRARAVWSALAERGVLVRNLDRPGPLAGCLRVTPGTSAENDLFLAALAEVLG